MSTHRKTALHGFKYWELSVTHLNTEEFFEQIGRFAEEEWRGYTQASKPRIEGEKTLEIS